MNLELFFNKLVARLQLGKIVSEPTRVSGGLMHMMYLIATDKAIYAVKILNPEVIKRSTAKDNFKEAERLEAIIEKNNLPIIAALVFDNKKMQELDGQYFYVYNWYDGKSIKNDDITSIHCKKISKAVASIHHIEVKKEKYKRDKISIVWEDYIKIANQKNPTIAKILEDNLSLLNLSQEQGNDAIDSIPDIITICHNDMDSKNVLWSKDEFKIIDLECLGYSSPYLEMLELALCWSGYEECKINFELFNAFIGAYFEDKPQPIVNWEALYYSNYGRLKWLEYNVKRALMIECSSCEEQKMGVEQVESTVQHIIYYDNAKDAILKSLSRL